MSLAQNKKPEVNKGKLGEKERHQRRRVMRGVLLFMGLAFCIGVALLFRERTNATTAVLNHYTYTDLCEGRGALYFDEMVPELLPAPEEAIQVEDGKRVRVDTPIYALNAEQKKRVQLLLNARQAAGEAAGTAEKKQWALAEAALDTGVVQAPFSSTVQFTKDGYEQLFDAEALSVVQPGDLAHVPEDTVLQPGLKFVENRSYALAVDLPPTLRTRTWSVGKKYALLLNDVKIEGELREVRGEPESGELLIFTIRGGYEAVREDRFPEVRIEVQRHMAFFVPTRAVFEEKGQYYCYVLDASDIARKTELHIMDASPDFTRFVVYAYSKAERSEKQERQLQDFDRILLNPQGTQEGELR